MKKHKHKRQHITIPRVVGLICLLVAVLSYFTSATGWLWYGVAGIVLLVAPTTYARARFDDYLATFGKWKTVLVVAVYDAFYYLVVFASLYFLHARVTAASLAAQATGITERLTDPATLQIAATFTQDILTTLVVGSLIVIIIGFFAYVVSRALIWTTIAHQKITKQFFVTFLGLNAALCSIFAVFFALILFGNKQGPQPALVALLIAAAYFAVIIHSLFMKTHQIGFSLSNGFGFGVGKIHLFIVPYTLVIVTYAVISQFFLFVPVQFVQPLSMLLVVLLFAFIRTYLYDIVKHIT